jgi:lactoylglutathione lyase
MKGFALVLAFAAALAAQQIQRPRITGIAHIALYVREVEQSRRFYKDFLGYAEPFSLNDAGGKLALTFFKINERQYVELFPEREPGSDRLHHIAIETDDAEAMRRYLASKGVPVPDSVPKGRIGNSNFNVKDPDGHTVEIVQYEADGWSVRERGKAMPETRISEHMLHVGIIVNSLEPAMKFYRDILGFQEIWRGSRDEKVLNWINMKVPDGEDYVEFMLHDPVPPPDRRGVAHHICLAVPDMDKAAAELQRRVAAVGYTRPLEVRTGINRRRQLNLYDPDNTRIELMEPHTVDGKPAPNSAAPPPK